MSARTSSPPRYGGRIAQVLVEAVESVASAEMRDRILDRSLAVAGLDEVPEQGRALLDFVDGYFRAALVSCLGEVLADEIIVQVEPMVRMAAANDPVSEVRPRGFEPALIALEPDLPLPAAPNEGSDRPTRAPSERATARAPEDFASAFQVSVPKPSKAPAEFAALELEPLEEPLEDPRSWLDDDDDGEETDIDLGTDRPHSEAPEFPDVGVLAMTPGPLGAVIFATPLSFICEALAKGLGGQTEVVHVADPLELLDRVEEHAPVSMVIVDCRSAEHDVATLATVIADLKTPPIFVLWGATEEMIDEVALASDTLRCLTIDADVSVAELAERCLAAG